MKFYLTGQSNTSSSAFEIKVLKGKNKRVDHEQFKKIWTTQKITHGSFDAGNTRNVTNIMSPFLVICAGILVKKLKMFVYSQFWIRCSLFMSTVLVLWARRIPISPVPPCRTTRCLCGSEGSLKREKVQQSSVRGGNRLVSNIKKIYQAYEPCQLERKVGGKNLESYLERSCGT